MHTVLNKASTRGRAYSHIEVRGHDECWPRLGTRTQGGYGVMKFTNSRTDQWTTTAHRVVWSVEHGREAPADMVIMHTCDNLCCCNPAHLRLGTSKETGKKRRFANRIRKLTDDQVRLIRAQAVEGKSCAWISVQLMISENHVRAIVKGERKAHVV